ncbi:MAG TPA: CBS domain-containing protein [Actinomycetota bacterium]|nr:CBS domain-containing protein [Actinomycetota bacterium]
MGMWSTIVGFGAGYALGANKDKESFRQLRRNVSARLPARFRGGSLGGRKADVRQLREVMTPSPRTVTPDTSLSEAARVMKEDDIGDVIVAERSTKKAVGIVTDRDITIRAVAESNDPDTTKVKDLVSGDLVSAAPSDTVEDAIKLMQGLNVRRLPVVDGGRAVGVVSLGDLSVEIDAGDALADISTAPPDR